MVELVARSACIGLLPLAHGALRLEEIVFETITSVAPFRGKEAEVSAALEAQIGAGFPAPGQTTGSAQGRAVWSGRGQALVLGPALAPIAGAAMTEQTDAWACVALEGPAARDVLARLMPLDLRPQVFEVGQAARTLLGHMTVGVIRTDPNRYAIMAFRSMAGTLVHELGTAMKHVAARGDSARWRG